MKRKLVVIGAGMASGRLIEHLVAEAPGAFDITLFNAEPRGTYNRIMLSPVLAGDKTYAEIVTHDDAWYAAQGVTCRFGEHVVAIDRAAKTVHGQNGPVAYDKLVIATGSAPFIIPVQGKDLPGVVTYRDLDDTNAMIAAAAKGGKAVVIGGGLLGLEAAAGLAERGMEVTVLHLMGHLMERQLDEAAGALLRRDLESRGLKIMTRASTAAILGTDRVEGVLLEDNTGLEADLVVMAVGIRPETRLATDARLEVARGIEVNARMQSLTDPDVYAVGECVEFEGHLFGLVAPLYDQARVLAQSLIGEDASFVVRDTATKLKVTGCDLFSAGDFAASEGREDIVLRDPARGVYKRLVLEGDRLVGAVMYGDTADGNWFFQLIKDGTNIEAMRETLIFGPDMQGGDPEDPFPAVAVLAPEAAQSGCDGLSRSSSIVPNANNGATQASRRAAV